MRFSFQIIFHLIRGALPVRGFHQIYHLVSHEQIDHTNLIPKTLQQIRQFPNKPKYLYVCSIYKHNTRSGLLNNKFPLKGNSIYMFLCLTHSTDIWYSQSFCDNQHTHEIHASKRNPRSRHHHIKRSTILYIDFNFAASPKQAPAIYAACPCRMCVVCAMVAVYCLDFGENIFLISDMDFEFCFLYTTADTHNTTAATSHVFELS